MWRQSCGCLPLAASSIASTSRTTLQPCLLTRSAHQWQRGGSPHKSRAPKSPKRQPSNLQEAERQALREVGELRAKLAAMDKRELAEQASRGLGKIDEDTLEQVYAAINIADPPTPEEKRLESRRRQRLESPDKYGYLETSHARKVARRLGTLKRRLDLVVLDSDAGGRSTDLTKVLESFNPAQMAEEEDVGEADASLTMEADLAREGRLLFVDTSGGTKLLQRVESIMQYVHADSVPTGIATRQEWEALAVMLASQDDKECLSRLLHIMQDKNEVVHMTAVVNAAMDVYASHGRATDCHLLLEELNRSGLTPDKYTYHCLAKAYISSNEIDRAVDLLAKLENEEAAEMQTYTMTIKALLQHTSSPQLQSCAWDLFHRMRLVAHPVPDAPLYAQMIKACAMGVAQSTDAQAWKPNIHPMTRSSYGLTSPARSVLVADTERALDLFREMTVRHQLRPTAEVYSMLILACVRRKDMYEKALSLFRSMVEMERGRYRGDDDTASFAPTRETYNALLQGCAKNGDLLRARWILTEMLRSATLRYEEITQGRQKAKEVERWELAEIAERRPDEATLSAVFFAYASYAVPKQPLSSTKSEVASGEARTDDSGEQGLTAPDAAEAEADEGIHLTRRMPSTAQAVIREATSLMERVKTDVKSQSGLLSSVRPNARMINAYLAVLSKHCNESERLEMLRSACFGDLDGKEASSLFAEFDVQMNGHTCQMLLDSCSKSSASADVMVLADRVWKIWTKMGGEGHLFAMDEREARRLGLDSRTISTTWSAMIRTLAVSKSLDAAMTLLRRFAELYPPSTASQYTSAASPGHSSSLVVGIRGKDIAQLQKTAIQSPTILFNQIAILHQRLVESGQHKKNLAYCTWLMKAYEHSFKPRMPDVYRGDTAPNRQAALQKVVKGRYQSSYSHTSSSMLRRSYG